MSPATIITIILSVLLILMLLSLFLYFSFPCAVFNFIFLKPKRSTKIPSFYKDSPHYKVSQAGLKIMRASKCEDVYINSFDNLKLHAYLFPAKDGTETKKFVLGIHGYKSYSRPEYAPYFEFYHNCGFNMILADDRAHSPSEGNYIGFGIHDRRDCVDWAKYLVRTYGEDIQIILHGVSMGGATVLSASGEKDLPKQVIGIVSDCGFSDATEILTYQLRVNAHIKSPKFIEKMKKICLNKAKLDLLECPPAEQVKKAKVPILFVHGQKDTMVPPEMADKLYSACSSEKKLLKVEEAGHGESIAFAPDEYYKAIKDLFKI